MTTARLDIVDEGSGVVLQTYRGIPLSVVATVCGWLNPLLSVFQTAATMKRQLTAPPVPEKGAKKRANR